MDGFSQMSDYSCAKSSHKGQELPSLLLSVVCAQCLALCNFTVPMKLPSLGFLSNCLVLSFQTTTLLLTDFVTAFSMPVKQYDHIPREGGSFSLCRSSCAALAPNKEVNPASASISTAVPASQSSREPWASSLWHPANLGSRVALPCQDPSPALTRLQKVPKFVNVRHLGHFLGDKLRTH